MCFTARLKEVLESAFARRTPTVTSDKGFVGEKSAEQWVSWEAFDMLRQRETSPEAHTPKID
ncbi:MULTISPECIES: hypothetical protein [Haloferax]|uniref:Uncharacterized protein n=2 Tax=Haloferax TaxID=2251 RepID=A0A6G1Z1M3_9EURY|nr:MULTISPECIES: hypothetical protein [Haloferax]KAB1187532.1 hypothetical protein Hfx1149_05590 [Haloferax sp. CBA1149]MRW80184.1 hypothetical protein [Haloferax marinisediminis]